MTNVAKMFYAVEDISKEYTFSLDSDVLRYLETLNGLTVPEAQEKLSKFFNETKHGSSLYAVNEFVKMFPKSSFAYTPESHPYRIVAVYNDTVYDVAGALKNKNKMYVYYCRIPVVEYCMQNLKEGESFIIIPPPSNCSDLDFFEYLFNNPSQKIIRRRLRSTNQ